MRVEPIVTPAALEAIAPAWADLFDRVHAAAPFASPAWLLPWWQTFAPGTLASVAVWSGADLVALAPLYVEDGPLGRRLLPLGIGISDDMDVLVDPAHADEAGPVLAVAIGAGQCDVWSAEEASDGAAVLRLPDPAGWISTVSPQSVAPVLDVSGGIEVAVPSGKRRKWRMAEHRAARRTTVLEAVDAASLPAALDHLVRLHGARWQSRGEAGVLADPRVIAFHKQAAPGLLASGLLRMSTLTIDGAVAGVYYGFARRGAAYAYLGGFDPAFAFESPGTLLVGHAMMEAAREGATAFHFLRGREPYKFEWGATERWTRGRRFERCR